MAQDSSSMRFQLQQPDTLPQTSTPVSAACLACRSRHLKCDAGLPACQRCRENNRECVYVKSRRGWKATTTSKDSGYQSKDGSAITRTTKRRIESEDGFDSYSSGQSTSSNMSPSTTPSLRHPSLVDLFYYFFHNSHPIMIPREFYGLFLSSSYDTETKDLINNLLVPVIHYIGSLYIKGANCALYKQAVEEAIFDEPASTGHQRQFIVPTSPISVMAMLLYAIVIHGESEQEMSLVVKDHAVDMALCLNMHDITFLDSYLDNSYFEPQPIYLGVLQESLRRTFWMLFVMDGWMNALHRRPPSALVSVVPTMELPCDDEEYNVGNIPVPHTLKEFDSRVFTSQPPQFSSFSYLIDAIRIMGVVIATMARSAVAEAAELADTSTSAWLLQIPHAKKMLLRPASSWPSQFEYLCLKGGGESQEVDELMMHAFIVINNFLILVHKPLSRLAMAPCEYDEHESYCVTPRSLLISFRANLATDNENLASGTLENNALLWDNTLKCMSSADTLSRLISVSPGTVNRRSPFFTCSITLSLLVHLTACVWVFYSPSAEKERAMVKERIKLGIGALRAMSESWSTAQHVLEKVQQAARIVFEQHRSADNFMRDVTNEAKSPKTVQSSAPAVIDYEPLSESDVVPLEWPYNPNVEPVDMSSVSSDAENYSRTDSTTGYRTDSTTGYSPSLNLDSAVLLEGSPDQQSQQQQQLHPCQSYPMLSELDRAMLRHMQMLPEPIISEVELLQMINEPDLVELYKSSPPISCSVNLQAQLF
ncbi:hypothetical protein V1509DRAFT_621885 [Lipomyces kononenkoae]